MIRLSASSIDNFLSCSKMFQYRTTVPELAVSTEYMSLGSIVHKVIEDKWNDPDYQEYGKQLSKTYSEHSIDEVKLFRCLEYFSNTFKPLLKENDLIEHRFSFKYDKDVEIVGKIDRIVLDTGLLIDWKTDERLPHTIDNDVQFILYYIAYKKIFGEYPNGVILAGLNKGQIINFKPNSFYIDTLMDDIIPDMLERIRRKRFVKEGLYNNSCRNCSFMTYCWQE